MCIAIIRFCPDQYKLGGEIAITGFSGLNKYEKHDGALNKLIFDKA